MIIVESQSKVLLPQGNVMRLTFKGMDSTPNPRFGDLGLGQMPGGYKDGTYDVMLAGIPSDPKEISLPPGSYWVFASRGPEYSVSTALLDLKSGHNLRLNIEAPQRELHTENYVAADLHVHSDKSFDSSHPVEARIRGYLAQGGEVLVSTEHETVYDFTNDIAFMGLDSQLATVTGSELTGQVPTKVTPFTIGHGNVFPLDYKPFEYRKGQPPHEGLRWREIMAAVRESNPDSIIQLNHPRYVMDGGYEDGYLQHLGHVGEAYNSEIPLTEWPNSVLIEEDPNFRF